MTRYEQGFQDGVLWAVARIVELHDEPTIAADVLRTSGVDGTRADEADSKYIAQVLDEPVLRKAGGEQ